MTCPIGKLVYRGGYAGMLSPACDVPPIIPAADKASIPYVPNRDLVHILEVSQGREFVEGFPAGLPRAIGRIIPEITQWVVEGIPQRYTGR